MLEEPRADDATTLHQPHPVRESAQTPPPIREDYVSPSAPAPTRSEIASTETTDYTATQGLLAALTALAHAISTADTPEQALPDALAAAHRLIPTVRVLRLYAVRPEGLPVLDLLATSDASRHEAASTRPRVHRVRTLGLGVAADRQVLDRRTAAQARDGFGVPITSPRGTLLGALVGETPAAHAPRVMPPLLGAVADHLAVLLARRAHERAQDRIARATDTFMSPDSTGLSNATSHAATPNTSATGQPATTTGADAILRRLTSTLHDMSAAQASLLLIPGAGDQLTIADGFAKSADITRHMPLGQGQRDRLLALMADRAELYVSEMIKQRTWSSLGTLRSTFTSVTGVSPESVLLLQVRAGDRTYAVVALALRSDAREREWMPMARAVCALAAERVARLGDEAAAREQAESYDRFLSLTAHELRSPLTSVKGYSQLLLRQAHRMQVPASITRSAEAIEQQAARMSEMIDEVHDAARIRGNRLDIMPRDADMVPIVEKLVQRWQAASSKHTFVLEIDAAHLPGRWDDHRVAQIVRALLDNATRYSPDGGEIGVRVWREDGAAYLSVRDPGIGIPTEESERIFDYLYRGPVPEQRNLAGLGLGLFVSRNIARQMGGDLRLVRGGRGGQQGSEFVLTLPLAE